MAGDRGSLRRVWTDGPVEVWRDDEVSIVWCVEHRTVALVDARIEDAVLREVAAWHLRREHA